MQPRLLLTRISWPSAIPRARASRGFIHRLLSCRSLNQGMLWFCECVLYLAWGVMSRRGKAFDFSRTLHSGKGENPVSPYSAKSSCIFPEGVFSGWASGSATKSERPGCFCVCRYPGTGSCIPRNLSEFSRTPLTCAYERACKPVRSIDDLRHLIPTHTPCHVGILEWIVGDSLKTAILDMSKKRTSASTVLVTRHGKLFQHWHRPCKNA
jgi:hypothetical protein